MNILQTKGWGDYKLLDSGEGFRLEQFADIRLIRPDPQCIWKKKYKEEWKNVHAVFTTKQGERGGWVFNKNISERILIRYKGLAFYIKFTPFKHTGIFPEQHLQWDWMEEKILYAKNRNKNKIRILNLFAYTGISSLVMAKMGCEVTHVDASAPSIGWARENQNISNLNDRAIRWIKDDVLAFCEREVRRGNKYDAIIMDPPVYGHGPKGQVWDFNRSFPLLLEACSELLVNKPIFILINAYAISASAIMLENICADYFGGFVNKIDYGELCLQEVDSERLLSTGIFARMD